MGERILLCLNHMSGRERDFVSKAFDGNWVVPMGPDVNAFEKDLESFVGSEPNTACVIDESGDTRWPQSDWTCGRAKKVVALSAGTAAVHLALIACGVGPGDEVICQSFTFCASCHPITYLGAKPVLVDSEAETWNMDPDLLETAIKEIGRAHV